MSRDYKLYLQDIVAEARFIEEQTRGMAFEAFFADEVRLKAVLQSLAVIGEAAHHIPENLQERLANIPWTEIVAVRNVIVHGYFALNLLIIWDIITNEITPLRQQIQALLATLDEEST